MKLTWWWLMNRGAPPEACERTVVLVIFGVIVVVLTLIGIAVVATRDEFRATRRFRDKAEHPGDESDPDRAR